MKRFNLIMLSLLLLSHNHNAQGYSFSWLVDSCVASCKEYAAQFNDLDVWKKTVCVLVGIAAFDKCISITKGTWNFLFRKSSRSSEPVSQEVTAMRVDIRQINERLASWQARNQDEEENSEDRMAESRQMKQIYSVLKKINLSLDEMQKEHIEIKKDTAVCQRLAISAAVKSQQVNTKLKQIGKISQPYKRASVPVRPSIVPRIWLPDETEAASPIRNKRARINAGSKYLDRRHYKDYMNEQLQDLQDTTQIQLKLQKKILHQVLRIWRVLLPARVRQRQRQTTLQRERRHKYPAQFR